MLDWIRQLVDTHGRPCPVIKMRKCPGTRAGCVRWVPMELGDGRERTVVEGCADLWGLAVQQMLVQEQARTQAGLDKAATELHRAGDQLGEAGQTFDRMAQGAGVLLRLAGLAPRRPGSALQGPQDGPGRAIETGGRGEPGGALPP